VRPDMTTAAQPDPVLQKVTGGEMAAAEKVMRVPARALTAPHAYPVAGPNDFRPEPVGLTLNGSLCRHPCHVLNVMD